LLLACIAPEVAFSSASRYPTGNALDVEPPLHGPAHLLAGGGGDLDEAFRWWIDEVRGCTDCDVKLDVVVLRASGADGYNDYLAAFDGVDSVDSFVIRSRRDAEQPALAAHVRRAELVFFAGGDQCRYVRFFRGTSLEAAVEAVFARGGGVGGSSAGLAIQGHVVYDACGGSATSARALADPYDERNTFTHGFFEWPHFERLVTDTHFAARDRMGRTLAFLARQIRDGVAPSVLAMGLDEATAVVVDRAGGAEVLGAGAAYLVLADHPPEVCERGEPLSYSDYKIWRCDSGSAFDLATRPSTGYYTRSVVGGKLSADPYRSDTGIESAAATNR
jgi:cyanophycinase